MYIKEIIFGGKCPLCGTPADAFVVPDMCDACKKQAIDVSDRVYAISGISRCRALYEYSGVIVKGVQKFKFYSNRNAGDFFGRKLSRFIATCPDFESYDFIVNIPNNPYKKADKRVFNQSEYSARFAARKTGKKFIKKALLKRLDVKSQIECKTYAERRENVKNAFSVRDASLIAGKRIIIIDDICTTGSTLKDAARALREGGAEDVAACVIAKVTDQSRTRLGIHFAQRQIFRWKVWLNADKEFDVKSQIVIKDTPENRDAMRNMMSDEPIDEL